jgi:hypothetical protein
MEIDESEEDDALARRIVATLENAGGVLIRSVNCLQNGSLTEANKAIHDARKVGMAGEELMKEIANGKHKPKTIGAIIIIVDSTKRIAEYGIGIAELAFNVHISS